MIEKNLKRWRLLLGKDVDKKFKEATQKIQKNNSSKEVIGVDVIDLNAQEMAQDEALEFLYVQTDYSPPSIKIIKWLEDIQKYFDKEIVKVLQDDALNYKGMKEVILEPDVLKTIEPDMNILETLLQLKHLIPDDNKDVVKEYIKKVVKEVEKELEINVKKSLQGIANKKEHSPIENLQNFDILKTIDKNLKNYDLKRKKIIADSFYFWDSQNKVNNWNIILDIDQSGSMCESIIYTSILSSILASVKSLNTDVIAFNTEVVNLSQKFNNNPIDILLSTYLDGGTDINKSVEYCRTLITNPSKTLFFLISDLYEGGVEARLKDNLREIKNSGAIVVVLLAITRRGKANYNKSLAKKIKNMDIPVLAITPQVLPMIIKKVIKKEDLSVLKEDYLQELD